MESRYKIPHAIQKRYLETVEKTSSLSGEKLAILFGVVGRSYRDWKRGKFSIPVKVADLIEKRFKISYPYCKEEALQNWKEAKLHASHLGGVGLIKKHGSPATVEGRRKGGLHALEVLRLRGVIPFAKPFAQPQGKSSELAEFVGILLGDGHIGEGQWSITVNSIADKQYAENISSLVEQLFEYKPGRFMKKDCNAIVLYGGGKYCIEYLQSLGLKTGNKITQQVGVPDWIKDTLEWRISCLRGLIDTDGGIFLHKYKVKGKEYVYSKLSFSNRSLPLIDFVYDTLEMVKLHPKKRLKEKSKQVWLYNVSEVKVYLDIIGTHNRRLLKNIWRDAGEAKREGLLNL